MESPKDMDLEILLDEKKNQTHFEESNKLNTSVCKIHAHLVF